MQNIDLKTPLGASQRFPLDELFVHSIQTPLDRLPAPGDTVYSVVVTDVGCDIRFKNGSRIHVPNIRSTELHAREVWSIIDKEGISAAGDYPEAACNLSEDAIRRDRRIRREAKKSAEKVAEEVDRVVAWAVEEFKDAVIDEKTIPEIKAQIEERMEAHLGFPVALSMAYYPGVEPDEFGPDHPGLPPMYSYPDFLEPVFKHRPQVDRTPAAHPPLTGDRLERSIAQQFHELGDKHLMRDIDNQLIYDMHEDICRILQPLSEEDLKPKILVRRNVNGDKVDVIYPPEIKAKVEAILDRWGDPRMVSGDAQGQQGPSPEEMQAFEEALAGREVVLHEISAIIGAEGKGAEWRMPLERLVACQDFPDKPMHAMVGYVDEGPEPINEKKVHWQIVFESKTEVGQLVEAIAAEAQLAAMQKLNPIDPASYGMAAAVEGANGGVATAVEVAGRGIDLNQPLEDLEKQLPNG